MYQLVMSTIHDEAQYQKYDSDSVVHGIPDLATATKALVQYCRSLSNAYGIDFVMQHGADPGEDSPTILGMWAPFPTVDKGMGAVYVEVQETKARDDVEEIVHMMRVNAKWANPDQYYTV